MQLEFSHVVRPRAAGAARAALPLFAAAEHAGFGRLVLEGSDGGAHADLEFAMEAIAGTSVQDIAINHRAGALDPPAAARRLAALDTVSGGRLSLRMDTGANVPGHLASHVEALKRTDEYLVLLKRLWSNATPFDHEGPAYSIRRGFVARKGPRGADIPVLMDGLSGTAFRIAGRHADLFELPMMPPDQLRHIVGRVRAAACDRGRSSRVRFALPIRFGLWGLGGSGETSVETALRAASPERLALALLPCFALGVTELMVRDLDTVEEIDAFARRVAPIVRNSAARCAPEPVQAPARPAAYSYGAGLPN